MAQYHIKPGKVGNALIDTYYKIENGVVGTYKKIEDGVVGTYKKIETAFDAGSSSPGSSGVGGAGSSVTSMIFS